LLCFLLLSVGRLSAAWLSMGNRAPCGCCGGEGRREHKEADRECTRLEGGEGEDETSKLLQESLLSGSTSAGSRSLPRCSSPSSSNPPPAVEGDEWAAARGREASSKADGPLSRERPSVSPSSADETSASPPPLLVQPTDNLRGRRPSRASIMSRSSISPGSFSPSSAKRRGRGSRSLGSRVCSNRGSDPTSPEAFRRAETSPVRASGFVFDPDFKARQKRRKWSITAQFQQRNGDPSLHACGTQTISLETMRRFRGLQDGFLEAPPKRRGSDAAGHCSWLDYYSGEMRTSGIVPAISTLTAVESRRPSLEFIGAVGDWADGLRRPSTSSASVYEGFDGDTIRGLGSARGVEVDRSSEQSDSLFLQYGGERCGSARSSLHSAGLGDAEESEEVLMDFLEAAAQRKASNCYIVPDEENPPIDLPDWLQTKSARRRKLTEDLDSESGFSDSDSDASAFSDVSCGSSE